MQSVGIHGGYLSPTGNIWDEGDRLAKTLSSLETLKLQYGGPLTSLHSLPWTNLWEGECSIFFRWFTLLFGSGTFCLFKDSRIPFFVDATLDLVKRVDVNSQLVSSKATYVLDIFHTCKGSTGFKKELKREETLYGKLTSRCPGGVVRGRPTVGQREPPLTPLPAVHGCIDGLVSPSTHPCILKVTLKPFSSVALRSVEEEIVSSCFVLPMMHELFLVFHRQQEQRLQKQMSQINDVLVNTDQHTAVSSV